MNEEITREDVADPVNGAEETTPVTEQGKVETPQTTETKKDVETTYSQKNLDDAYAKGRGTAERETRRKLLAQLGLKDGEEDKLQAFKQAYENSLTEEERRNQEIETLQAEKVKLEQDLEEAKYIVKALSQLTGKKEEDVQDIVDMARGLRKDEMTIDDAIEKVIEKIKPSVDAINDQMPKGQELQQPSTNVVIDTTVNPFKTETWNLSEQGKLFRENPELFNKMKAEAGIK